MITLIKNILSSHRLMPLFMAFIAIFGIFGFARGKAGWWAIGSRLCMSKYDVHEAMHVLGAMLDLI